MLSEIFTSVDCLTLPIPDRTRAGLQHLGDKQNTNSEWVDALDAIRYRLFGDENVATGTGGELLGKIRMLVESVQQANNFPEVPSVWESLLSMQNQSAVAEAMNVFDAIMDKKVTPEHPMNEDEFSNALAGAEAVSKRVLRKLLFDIDSLYAKCLVQLKNVIDARMWVLKDRNNVNLKTYCNRERKAILERYKEMIQDIEIPINKNRLDEALERAEQEAVTGQGVFFDTCVKYRNDLMADINRARSDYVEANSKKIDAFLKGIGDKSIATYNVEFDLALSKIDLTKHSEKGATDAKWRLKLFTTQDFEKLAKELADTVVQSFRLKGAAYATESEYESQLQRVRREIALLEEEKHSAIKEKIEHAVTSVFNKEYDIYRSLANELKLPLPRKVMEEKNKEFKAKCERDIKDEIGDEIFSSEDELYASVVSKAKRNFVTMVETYWNDFTVRENEDMYSTNIAEPFRQAKAKVRDKCSKDPKADFNGCARKIIEKELRYTFASEELKNRAINEFIIKEDIVSMAPKKSNYAIVLTFLIGGLVIVFVFGLFVQEDSH